MENREVTRITVALLLALSCFGGQPKKPACNSASSGRFWPEEANSSPEAVRRASHCGSLLICRFTGLRYKWESVTVNAGSLGKTPRPPAPECVAAEPVEPAAAGESGGTK